VSDFGVQWQALFQAERRFTALLRRALRIDHYPGLNRRR